MRDNLALSLVLPSAPRECRNLVGGGWVSGRGRTLEVLSPYSARTIGSVTLSTASDVDEALCAAHDAAQGWADIPLKERVIPLRKFAELAAARSDEIANTIALESGKTQAEALAGLARGLEVVEFALSLPNFADGTVLEVSRGVTCETRREPLGVVGGITPFNFPAMVPMWMFPIAIALGNAFVLKPSEKVPLTACTLGALLTEAGIPPGVFSVVHGDREGVRALVAHRHLSAVGFVGSTPVARAIYARATGEGKRALCLGGAKNHLIAAPDADPALTIRAVVDSFTGCAGQRCMAGSVLVVVGAADRLIDPIVRAASAVPLGTGMGALIDAAARERLVSAIARAEADGAEIALDGRKAAAPAGFEQGHWLGPTVVDRVRAEMECATVELFGPLLSIVRVGTLEEALALDGASPYGNATCVFTSSGAVARRVAHAAKSGMIGINVGVPVPRDPFPFGGTKQSRFGQGDMTGPGGVDLWTQTKKITTRWSMSRDANWMS